MDKNSTSRKYALNASFAAIGRIAPLAVQLAVTPYIIANLGVDAFAIWAILSTTISLMLTADLGVVGIMQRYHSVARATNNRGHGGRITATVLLFLISLLIILTIVGPWIADGLTAVIQVAPGLKESAWIVFRYAGTISVMQLIALALMAYLAAHNRFLASASASIIARIFFIGALTFVLSHNMGLPGLLLATFIDGVVAILVAGAMCWRHLVFEVRGLVNRSELKELWSYSWRNQASAVGFVAQRESDVIMAAVLLPAAFQATIAASAQLAAAIAFAPTIALIPLFTSLSSMAGTDPDRVVEEAQVAETRWFSIILPFGALALGISPFATVAWLGPTLPDLTAIMALLTAGFLVVLANSVRAVFVRAIGKPGIETNSYIWLLLGKLVIGIPATLIWGIYGLAASTIFASAVSVFVMLRSTWSEKLGMGTVKVSLKSIWVSVVVFLLSIIFATMIERTVPARPIQIIFYIVLALVVSGLAWLVQKSKPKARNA